MKGKYKIVDGHVHTFQSLEIASRIIESFNKIYDITFENPGVSTIEDILENMNQTGIDYTVMANFAPPKIIHGNNLWTLDMAQKHKCLIPLVSFHPEMEGDMQKLLAQYIKLGARGIKLHPMAQGFNPGNEKLAPLYEYCSNISLPIVFHCGRVANARLNEFSDVEMIIPVIGKYPDIPVVLTHMADGNSNDVFKLSAAYKNVYFDTSIVITGYPPLISTNKPSWLDDGMVCEVVNKIGAEKLLFGSDYPWGSPYHDLNRFLKLDLSDKQKELILGSNAIKLFGIAC